MVAYKNHRESPFRITLQKRAQFAFSMQNRIHYLRWTAALIVVTKSFLTGTKNDKYGIRLPDEFDSKFCIQIGCSMAYWGDPTG